MSALLGLPANPQPLAKAVYKQSPQDFSVDEELGFQPSDSGEHVLLQLSKTDLTTDQLQQRVARVAGVAMRSVSFSGLKDRYAVTTQWFSVHLPGRADPDWTQLQDDQVSLLQARRHHRKLRRGTHVANRFEITLRQVQQQQEQQLQQALQRVQQQGFPNYFGSQRFGRNGNNLQRARAGVKLQRLGRQQRGYILSAARSYLFNQVLSLRVQQGNWRQLLAGDVAQLRGTNSVFAVPELTPLLQQRLLSGDICPTGPLWGEGELLSQGEVAVLEQTVAQAEPELRALLQQPGLKHERRPLVVQASGLEWQWLAQDCIKLAFSLPRGCYATALLGELVSDPAEDMTNHRSSSE